MVNPTLTTLFVITLGAVVTSILFYKLSFSTRTVFRGRMPMLQFLFSIVVPPLLTTVLFQLYRILERKEVVRLVPLSDDGFLLFLFFMIALASVGNGMHAAGVSIDYKAQNLDELDDDEAALIRVVEFFHHTFSHFLVHLPSLLCTFVFIIFELNHYEVSDFSPGQLTSVVLLGIVFGLIFSLSVIEGGGARLFIPLYPILTIVSLLLTKSVGMTLFRLPVTMYFLGSYFAGFIMLSVWGLYYKGFPEIMGELKIKDGHPKSPGAKSRRVHGKF